MILPLPGIAPYPACYSQCSSSRWAAHTERSYYFLTLPLLFPMLHLPTSILPDSSPPHACCNTFAPLPHTSWACPLRSAYSHIRTKEGRNIWISLIETCIPGVALSMLTTSGAAVADSDYCFPQPMTTQKQDHLLWQRHGLLP